MTDSDIRVLRAQPWKDPAIATVVPDARMVHGKYRTTRSLCGIVVT